VGEHLLLWGNTYCCGGTLI